MAGELYVMIASTVEGRTNTITSLGEELRSTIRTSATFKKVYEAGIQITGISHPSLGYRQAIERVKSELAIQVWEQDRPGLTFTIALVKKL
mgnify:CR=1 FL=1